MKKMLITGASGFIGRNFIRRYSAKLKPSEVLCFVHDVQSPLEESGREIIKKCGLEMKEVDLVTKNGLDKKWKKPPETIIHLAASADTSKFDHRCNDEGTVNLLRSLGKLNSNIHLIYTSTTAVYAGRRDCSRPINELSLPQPSNEYSRTKLETEKILSRLCKRRKFRLTILRLSTVYGSHTRPNGLFAILKKLISQKSIISRLNWPGLTSLVDVNDVAYILWLTVKSLPPPGEPQLYIVSSESLSLSEISKVMHKGMKLSYKEIRLPVVFWFFLSASRKFIPLLESILPSSIYNYFWRFSLIVDNALYCDSSKITKRFPKWNHHKFQDGVYGVVR